MPGHDGHRRPTRRRLIAGLAASAGSVTGCLAIGGPPGDDAGTEAESTTTNPYEYDLDLSWGMDFSGRGIQARPDDVAVQRSFHVRSDDGPGVHAVDDRRFVFVTVVTDHAVGITPAQPADFAVEIDGERYPGWTTPPDVDGRPVPDDLEYRFDDRVTDEEGRETVYGRKEIPGWLGFEVPARASDPPTLTLQPTQAARPYATWPFPGRVVDRLLAPPTTVTVPDITLPASVGPGEEVPVSVTATNDGDADTRLRVAVAGGSASRLGGTDLPAGETRTWEGAVPAPTDADAVAVTVETGPRTVTRDVEIE